MKNISDVIAGSLLFLIGGGAIVGAIRLKVGTPTEPQPGFFPFLGGVCIIFMASIIFVQGWLGRSKVGADFGAVQRPALLVGVLALFIVGLDLLGYIISTPIIVAVVMRLMGIKSWRVLILTSIVLAFGTYFLFDKLLGISLPLGLLS